MTMNNKVAFITDADCETGIAIAKKLLENGCYVGLNCRSGRNDYYEFSDRAMVLNIDPADECETAEAVKFIVDRFGKIDLLVHNNNEISHSTIEATSEAEFMNILRVNTKSAFVCTRAVASSMIEKKSGRIVYISSIHDEKPTGCAFAYSVSKGAVKMLAKEVALDLGIHNIKTNLVEMGPVLGDDVKFSSKTSFVYENYISKIPGNVLSTYDDLAKLVLYLASDECTYMNGQDIWLDGGFVLHYIDRSEENAEESL
jgi:NAD(P)-dependent dehydrogenase (short-subunit alcohol dehydrogenase family)